jgi:hypothetical protein
MESENSEVKADRLRLAQENERFRIAGFEKDGEILSLQKRLLEQDSVIQDMQQRRNNISSEKQRSKEQPAEGTEKSDRRKRQEEKVSDHAEQLSADEIRRLQEQERSNNGKPSDPLPSGKLPKPKKEKKVKKEKVIIPETIIID